MAIPAFVGAGSGVTITGASGTVSRAGCTAGNLVIVHFLVDGTGGVHDRTNFSNVQTLGGTANDLTFLTAATVGSPLAASHELWIGRCTANGTCQLDLTSDSLDLYARLFEFSGVSAGTLLGDVIEEGTQGGAGQYHYHALTNTIIQDAGVQSLGNDRLACNFIAVNTNLALATFSGQTGGTWAEPVAEYSDVTGTAGTIGLQTADMAAPGTIDGGTITIASNPWGTVGFALIPAAPAAGTYLFLKPTQSNLRW